MFLALLSPYLGSARRPSNLPTNAQALAAIRRRVACSAIQNSEAVAERGRRAARTTRTVLEASAEKRSANAGPRTAARDLRTKGESVSGTKGE